MQKSPFHLFLLPLCLLLSALLATSCGTARRATEGVAPAAPAISAAAQRTAATALKGECVTARVKMDVSALGKDVTLSGTLRMKRNDVVQLSLSLLGFEVGRMEFTPADVLIIDRVNKQYVRAPYSQVSFLRTAQLDFYALQSLFWNELFVPGQTSAAGSLQRFRAASAGSHTLLTLPDAPRLAYEFLTVTESGLIDRVTVQSRSAAEQGRFEWRYSDFVPFGARQFPGRMQCSVKGAGKDAGFTLSLSRLGSDSDWQPRTAVSSKYRQRNADELLGRLFSL